MQFPDPLIRMLCIKYLGLYKELLSRKELAEKREITSKEKEELKNRSFSIILKDYAAEKDWKIVKSDMGKMMNQWRQEKEQMKEALWQRRIEEAAEMEMLEKIRSGELEPSDDSLTSPLEQE
jgi:hypothetical protein